jgi:hypothetical protein
MPDRTPRRPRAGEAERRRAQAAAQEATIAREQAGQPEGGPDAGTVTEDAHLPKITLKTGDPVDARAAVAILDQLRAYLAVHPEEFRSLLALAEGRPGDADPGHFQSLHRHAFMEDDGRSISPEVRSVLLNSYVVLREGPVLVPLRLQNEADRAVAEEAQKQLDRWYQRVLFGRKGGSRDLPP